MSSIKQAVVLIGHGGLPSDCPEKLIQKFILFCHLDMEVGKVWVKMGFGMG